MGKPLASGKRKDRIHIVKLTPGEEAEKGKTPKRMRPLRELEQAAANNTKEVREK